MDKVFLIPRQGVLVRNPAKLGKPIIKAEGEFLRMDSYLMRRVRDGDLVIGSVNNDSKTEEA